MARYKHQCGNSHEKTCDPRRVCLAKMPSGRRTALFSALGVAVYMETGSSGDTFESTKGIWRRVIYGYRNCLPKLCMEA